MKTRVISAIVFALIIIPAIIFGGLFFLALTLFCAFVGTYELMNMFYKKSETLKELRYLVPLFSCVLVILYYMQGLYANAYTIELVHGSINVIKDLNINGNLFLVYSVLIFTVYLFFIIILMTICTLKKNTSAHDITSCITSLTYGGLLLGAAFSVEYIKPIVAAGENVNFLEFIVKYVNGKLFAFLYIVVAFTDMFAYFIGCKFGRHKLCPDISPKKSVEGAIGGLIVGALTGTLLSFVLGVLPVSKSSTGLDIFIAIVFILLLAIFIAVVEQIGDLVASKLKRSYDIKDYGKIMPGHGGVMDRFDSLILSGSLLYAVIFTIKVILLIGAL